MLETTHMRRRDLAPNPEKKSCKLAPNDTSKQHFEMDTDESKITIKATVMIKAQNIICILSRRRQTLAP